MLRFAHDWERPEVAVARLRSPHTGMQPEGPRQRLDVADVCWCSRLGPRSAAEGTRCSRAHGLVSAEAVVHDGEEGLHLERLGQVSVGACLVEALCLAG